MTDTSFEEAWQRASRQKGWFSRGEARALFELACEVAGERCIVEIGSYAGRATTVLAHSGREVIAVDPLVLGTAPTGTWQVTEEHVTVFERVLAAHANVTWRRMRSTDCPGPAKPIGLLLIDGEHDHPAPREDYEHFEPWLAPRALVLFHDYKVCRGVTETADALVEEGRIERVKLRERLFVGRVAPR
ncbi:MAG: class I SAM-dependent methyltransferase [Planctomycetota bacterium]